MNKETKLCPYCLKDIPVLGWESHFKFSHVGKVVPKMTSAVAKQEPAVRDVQTETAPKTDVKRFASNGLYIPTRDVNFIVKSSIVDELKRAGIRSQSSVVNIMLVGAPGSGKTSLARQDGAHNQSLYCEVQCGLMTEPTQWFGSQKFNPEIGTYYQESQFVKAVETPNCRILLDEINRVENPKVLNSLFWLLDDRGEAYIDDLQRTVKRAMGVIFFATLNEGVIFSGVDFMDTALRDRFYVIQMEFPPEDSEIRILTTKTGIAPSAAHVLVYMANTIRQDPTFDRKVSTRQLLMAARDIVSGATIRDAVQFAVSNTFQEKASDVMKALQAFIPETEARGMKKDEWINF